MSTSGKDKSGRVRIRCSAAKESGTCPDPKTFYLDTIEKAVLDGLGSELRHLQVIAEYVRTYQAERKRLPRRPTPDGSGLSGASARLRVRSTVWSKLLQRGTAILLCWVHAQRLYTRSAHVWSPNLRLRRRLPR